MKVLQCKDIPTLPILEFIFTLKEKTGYHWGTILGGFDNSVQNAMQEVVPEELAIAKMKSLIAEGYINGCLCGCRGDFELFEKLVVKPVMKLTIIEKLKGAWK